MALSSASSSKYQLAQLSGWFSGSDQKGALGQTQQRRQRPDWAQQSGRDAFYHTKQANRSFTEAKSRRVVCQAAVTINGTVISDGARLCEMQAKNVQIEGLGSYRPKRTVTTEDTIQMAIDGSPSIEPRRLTRLLKKLFKNLGSISRQWSEDPSTDRPVNWLQEAFQQALSNAGWSVVDVDVIIHTGIVRGVLEPSAAAVYSKVLGTRHAQAFDVVDACNSWVLAAQLADSMIKAGTCRRVALVSTISANNPYLEEGYKIDSWEQIGYKVAGLTVGSAASVTLIGGGHQQDWGLKVTRVHDADHVALCMINEPNTMCHLGLDDIVPCEIKEDYFGDATMPPQFYSQGTDLFELQLGWFRDVLSKALLRAGKADVGDVVMTHSAFETHYTAILKELGLQDRHFNIHAENGNLADNTCPVALKQAIEAGRVSAYDRVSYIGQASGASTALATFNAPKALVERLGPQQVNVEDTTGVVARELVEV